jgi:hypothetical protein
MNLKLIDKLKSIESEIESHMDALDMSYSLSEQNKIEKIIDKLKRQQSKLKKKIKRTIENE